MAHQHIAYLPVIATTYTARLGERIYWHLRQSMETSDKLDKKIHGVMNTPLKELAMRPSFQALMSQANLHTTINNTDNNHNYNADTDTDTDTNINTDVNTDTSIITKTGEIQLRSRIRHHPGEAIFPPGPDCSYLKHIEAYYRNFRCMQYKRYLTQINARLERQLSGEPLTQFVGDSDLNRVEGWLHDRVRVAEKYVNLKLNNAE